MIKFDFYSMKMKLMKIKKILAAKKKIHERYLYPKL